MATYLNNNQTKDFHENGYVIVKNFFNQDETYLLQNASKKDPAIRDHLYERKDSEGLITKMMAWNHPDDSIYGVTARSEKLLIQWKTSLVEKFIIIILKLQLKNHMREELGNGIKIMDIGITMVACFHLWLL